MSKNYRLALQIEGQSTIQIEGEFLDNEFKILEMYLMQYDELARSGPLQRGIPCRFALNFNEIDGLSSSSELPSKDDLSILLHQLRPFILHNEPASFNQVCGILKKQFSDPRIQTLFSQSRELYDGRQFQKLVKINSNEDIINSEKILNDWLNSYEYHRDLNKRQAIDKLFEFFPGDFFKGLFVSMILDKVDAIRNIAKFVMVVFGRETKFQFKNI
jgi:hypothetical protein